MEKGWYTTNGGTMFVTYEMYHIIRRAKNDAVKAWIMGGAIVPVLQ